MKLDRAWLCMPLPQFHLHFLETQLWNKGGLETEEGVQAGEAGLRLLLSPVTHKTWVAPGLVTARSSWCAGGVFKWL